MRYIYIAAPYTSDPDFNVGAAIKVAETLIEKGYIPFVPHLCHIWDQISHHDYEYWMEYVMAWLKKCDAVLRVPGHSLGADREVELANELGKTVYFNLEELKQ